METRLPQLSTSTAYLFLMVSLLLGLPILTAYYNVNPEFFYAALVPYLAISTMITLIILRQGTRNARSIYNDPSASERALREMFSRDQSVGGRKSFIARFNSNLPLPIVLLLVTAAMALYEATRYLVESTYPFSAPQAVDYFGWAYLIVLGVASVVGFSKLLYGGFPTLRMILEKKRYAYLALAISGCFALVYSLVVNGILIVGLNTQGTTPPPSGTYPYVFPPMVPGTPDSIVNLVYLPTGLIQVSYSLNFIIIPFEVVFTALLSLLVGSSVAMAHYLISTNGLRCSTKGAALSTTGSILGLTATCPTCLVPAFVTAMLFSVGAAGPSFIQAAYSNIYGVVLPPLLSLATLVVSLVYLSRAIRKGAPV